MAITAQVRFQGVSQMPEDVYINTFHFVGSAGAPADDAILAGIVDFYNGNSPNLPALSKQISHVVSRATPVQVRLYERTAGAPSGAPYFTGSFVLGPVNANDTESLPEEVAVVASFFTADGVGNVLRRGRVYIGPLSLGTSDGGDNSNQVNVTGTYMEAVRAAMVRLNNGVPSWATLSHVPGISDTTSPVTGGFVDNAFDTQRRRGTKADARMTWTEFAP